MLMQLPYMMVMEDGKWYLMGYVVAVVFGKVVGIS